MTSDSSRLSKEITPFTPPSKIELRKTFTIRKSGTFPKRQITLRKKSEDKMPHFVVEEVSDSKKTKLLQLK